MNTPPFPSVESTTLVTAPAYKVFAQWKNFVATPNFIVGLKEVRKIGDKQFSLVTEVCGVQVISIVEIVLEIPQRRIAWRTVAGASSCGVVQIDPHDADTTRVTLKIKYDPIQSLESPASVESRIQRSLQKMREIIELPESAPIAA